MTITANSIQSVEALTTEFHKAYANVASMTQAILDMDDNRRIERARAVRLVFIAKTEHANVYGSTRSKTGVNIQKMAGDFIPGNKSLDGKRRELGRYLEGLAAAESAGLTAELGNLDEVPTAALVKATNIAWAAAADYEKTKRAADKVNAEVETPEDGGIGSESTTDEPNTSIPTVLTPAPAVSGDVLVAALTALGQLMDDFADNGLELTADQKVVFTEYAGRLEVMGA